MSDDIVRLRFAKDVADWRQNKDEAEWQLTLAQARLDAYDEGVKRGRELGRGAHSPEDPEKRNDFDNSRELPDKRHRDDVVGPILTYLGRGDDWVNESAIITDLKQLKPRSVENALRRLYSTGRIESHHGVRGNWRYRLPPAASQAVAADPSPRQAPLEKPPVGEAEASFPFEEGEQDRQLIVRVYSFIQGCGDMGAGESQLDRLGADAAVIASLVASRDIEEFHHPQHGQRWRVMQPEK